MGFRLPSALAGNDNEVSLDGDGARTVAEHVGGVVAGLSILTAGVLIYRRATEAAGQNSLGDLY